MLFRFLSATLLASAYAAAAVHGQSAPVRAAVSALAAIPVGPLIDNRGSGAGATASLRYAFPGIPFLGISAEIGGLAKSVHTNSAMGDIPAIVTNGSSALIAGIGPRLSLPVGGGRVYLTGTAGIARLWASSFVNPLPASQEQYDISASNITTLTTNFAWSGGGGVVMPIPGTSSRAAVDLGVRYYDLGTATYARPYTPYTPQLISGAEGVFPETVAVSSRARATIVAPSAGIVLRF
jgi:hypothetical protein